MDVNATNIEEIVRQVLNSMEGRQPAANSGAGSAPAGAIPKTAHVAMLTSLEHYDVKEFPIPEVGDDDILVKAETAWKSFFYDLSGSYDIPESNY